jgi:serine/threonine protein kinase
MGVVYKARQAGLNRVVALKMVLAGGHAGPAELARFRVEAEAVARQQHPNIVGVFEVGEAGGRPFLSLEFCPHGSLEQKLGGTPLPPEEAARLVSRHHAPPSAPATSCSSSSATGQASCSATTASPSRWAATCGFATSTCGRS